MANPDRSIPSPEYQGYVDERSTHHVRGWARNLADPLDRLEVEIMLDGQVLAAARADRFGAVLVAVGVGDGLYVFQHGFDPPLRAEQRDRVIVRPRGTVVALELAPALVTEPPTAPAPPVIGYVDERSRYHVAGWMMDVDAPTRRVEYSVLLPSEAGERLLAVGSADGFSPTLAELGVGDATYAFTVTFPVALTAEERDRVVVRRAGIADPVPLAPMLKTVFEPISHVAMDIVNNCNLRCPFCVFDYSQTRRTELMDRRTFDAAFGLLPFVSDGNFWLSCLHEATLHPELLRFVALVPFEYRRKLMFTTNLAKRMPDAYLAAMAESGIHHINVSLESLEPELYERMRKGARHHIFRDNWERLLAAFATAPAPRSLRCNIMAYRSNLREIPAMIATLRETRRASYIEIRDTMPEAHIPADFLDAERLGAADWQWLRRELRDYPREQVNLLAPSPPLAAPEPIPADQPARATSNTADAPLSGVPRPLKMRIDWTGHLIVHNEFPEPGGLPRHQHHLLTNVNDITDPIEFLTAI